MVSQALVEVPTIGAAEAHAEIQANPNTLVVDVRDPADIVATGIIPGAVNVTLGTLTYKADHGVPLEWRDPNFEDFARPIITTCETGEMAALAGKLLKEMGYTNVRILRGATVAWKEAGYPTVAP
jgi:rhodanese-related sulfurtransferase